MKECFSPELFLFYFFAASLAFKNSHLWKKKQQGNTWINGKTVGVHTECTHTGWLASHSRAWRGLARLSWPFFPHAHMHNTQTHTHTWKASNVSPSMKKPKKTAQFKRAETRPGSSLLTAALRLPPYVSCPWRMTLSLFSSLYLSLSLSHTHIHTHTQAHRHWIMDEACDTVMIHLSHLYILKRLGRLYAA